MLNAVFAVPAESGPQPLIVTPQDGAQTVTPGSLTGFLGSVSSLAGAASEVHGTWGEIQGLSEQEEPDPQPTERNMRQGDVPEEGMGLLGLGTTGVIAGAIVGVLVYMLGGNIAWTLIAAVAAALLVPSLLA